MRSELELSELETVSESQSECRHTLRAMEGLICSSVGI